MPDSNSASGVSCVGWLWRGCLLASGSSRRILGIWRRFSGGLSSDLLLGGAWFGILIVSSVSTTGCLWLIGCWTLSIIAWGWPRSRSISRIVSSSDWLSIMFIIFIIGCILSVVGRCSIFNLSIHYVMYLRCDYGGWFLCFLSLIMNIILYTINNLFILKDSEFNLFIIFKLYELDQTNIHIGDHILISFIF